MEEILSFIDLAEGVNFELVGKLEREKEKQRRDRIRQLRADVQSQ